MAAFKQARGARGAVADEYSARAAEIGAKIDAMHAKADKEAHQCLESMQGLATDFDFAVAQGKKEWRAAFNEKKKEKTALNAAVDEEISGLDAAIKEENEACTAYSAAEIEPIRQALREHGEVLGRQVAERQAHQKELREDTASEFARLRQRLQRETERRERQCKETLQEKSGFYEELKAKLQEQHASMRSRLDIMAGKIVTEKGERAKAHEAIVEKLEHVMDELEKNMSNVRLGATAHKDRLQKLRKQLVMA